MSQFSGMDVKTADSLWDWNDTIMAIDSISDILKTVNDYLFSQLTIGDSLDSTEISILTDIALLCPFRYGMGVYGARSIIEALDTMKTHYYNCCELQADECEEYKLEEKAGKNQSSDEKVIYNLYPNPSSDEFTFEYSLFETEPIRISLHDLTGEKVFSKLLRTDKGKLRINTSTLSGGIYLFYVIKGSEISQRQKVCIIR